MPKRNAKPAKTSSVHDQYDLPEEVDFGKTRFIGFGLDALERHAARKQLKHMVGLDPDVAKVFKDGESVNRTLRAIISILPTAERKRNRKAG